MIIKINIVNHLKQMIKKIITRQLLTLPKFSFSADHHAPGPKHLEKAQNTMIYLFIKNADSVYEKVPAYEGESLLETIMRMKVKSFESNVCDGYDATYRPHHRPHDPFSDGPQCGYCRVILEDNWYNRVDKETDGMSQQEVHCLKETVSDIQVNTRLACCVPIESWMNGMTLRVDPGLHEGGVTELH